MPNSKISALTAATTPLAGTEVLPIVQSGATKQVSVANLTAGRAVSAASLALTTSPLPTTSGGTALTSFTNKGVVYASSTSALATGSALEFDGTNFGVGTGGNTMNHQSVLYRGGANAVYHQIGNGLTGLASTQGIRLGLTAAAASELYTINSFNLYVDGSSAISITSARNTTFTGGNLVQGTAAKGVNFTANTPAAGMTSQLLNWYEEVTAASTACTGAITTAASWTLTRVGNVITLTLPPITGAATSSAYFEFGVVVPSGYRPASSLLFPCGVRDNDANQSTVGMCIVTSSGNIRIYPNIAASANFTANVSATAAGFAQGCGFSCSWRL